MMLVPMIAVCIVIIASLVFVNARTVIVSGAQEKLLQEAKADAADIAIKLENVRAYYSAVADVLENIEFNGKDDIFNKFQYTAKLRDDMYPGFYGKVGDEGYLDMTGWIPGDDFDMTTRAWYKAGLGKSEMTWGTPYVDGTDGGMNVSVAREVNIPGSGSSIIAADLYLKDLSNEVSEYTPSGTGRCVLFDDSLAILAS